MGMKTTVLWISVAISAALAQEPTFTTTLPDSILDKTEKLNWLGKVNSFCEGPVYDAANGVVYWTEQKSSQANWPIWRYDTKNPGTAAAVFVQNAYQANGLELDPQGRLVAMQNKRITRYKKDGTEDSVLVTSPQNGVSFNQANDLSHMKDGSFYFTDLASNVYYLSKDRQLKVAASGLQSPNGIQVVEEENAVYVNQVYGNKVTRFEIDADFSLKNPTPFLEVTTPDGVEMDQHGNWYFGIYQLGEFRVFDPAAKPLGGLILTPASNYDASRGVAGNICNVAFGGADNKTLFITGDGGLYSIKLKIAGRPRVNAVVTGIAAGKISPRARMAAYRLGSQWKIAMEEGFFGPDGRWTGKARKAFPLLR